MRERGSLLKDGVVVPVLSVERLGKRMGRVSEDEMAQIVEGLNEIIGEQSAAGYRR